MTCAWEVTTDDVQIALREMGMEFLLDGEEVHDLLDHALIDEAALAADSMDAQVDYASREIVRQVRELIDDGAIALGSRQPAASFHKD